MAGDCNCAGLAAEDGFGVEPEGCAEVFGCPGADALGLALGGRLLSLTGSGGATLVFGGTEGVEPGDTGD
ncbi:hypothetical protein [Vampirovibrio chlorellavorus]|uniref:hypothetical protein n=1 Tax=Vampirovibrio chlorellavorus TaxID=758823 RepID=UPI003FCD693E